MAGRSGPLRFALIGCGYWGKNYGRLIAGNSNHVLVACCDTQLENARGLAAQYPGTAVHGNLDQLLQQSPVDCAVVATPANTHYDIATRLLHAGVDVLIEKPLTTDVTSSVELQQSAAARGRILMVDHTYVFHPAVRQMKACINEGLVGEVRYATARRTHLGLIRADVSVTWDLAPHDVSILDYFLGTGPEVVAAVGTAYLRPDRHDLLWAHLRYPGGALASIYVAWMCPGKERTVEVVGTRGRIVFDEMDRDAPLKHYPVGIAYFSDNSSSPQEANIAVPIPIGTQEPLQEVVREFVECVRTRRQPVASAEHGAAVVRTLVAIETAALRRS